MGDTIACSNDTPRSDSLTPCPPDGRFQYNTDVVFSEDGTVSLGDLNRYSFYWALNGSIYYNEILAKYHKTHLYFEPAFDAPAQPDPQHFTTSFGVTFGIMICFDIMFPYPQVNVHKKKRGKKAKGRKEKEKGKS